MFPSSFFKTIQNNIMPELMEIVYKLRSEMEHSMEKLNIELRAVKDVVKGMDKDSHPPIFTTEDKLLLENRLEKLELFEKKVRNKKAFKSLNAK